MLSFFRAQWRAIIVLLILAVAAVLIAYADYFDLITLALFLLFIASQVFWIGRILDLGERFIPGKPRRLWLALVAGLVYLFVFAYSFPGIESSLHVFRPVDYPPSRIVTEAAYWWWFVGSQMAFLLVIAFGMADRAARAAAWVYGKASEAMQGHRAALKPDVIALDPSPTARRRFLEQTALLVSATPFVAAGYGLLYGRLDVEVVRQRIHLARLPKVFEGFRIAQLSDIHLGPFTTADYIRHCVTITNGLKPDLVVLTGDYICWNPSAEGEAVRALADLRAPHGVFGCLGNHEEEGKIEESITPLFAAQGIHMLRQASAAIRLSGATLNLIGMDEPRGEEWERDVYRRLQQVKGLVMPGTVNILLLHYPAVFDYIAELGIPIDLTLAGHTHGGQLSLDFVHRGLDLGRLVTHYVSGWYEKGGHQLYVNRGIGTTGFPIRLGARPEVTVFELTRET
jgi:uncharacterized protein